MAFVSFAQHLEDVMLYRALKAVDRGFYIDVGAQDPTHNSVTKAFYDRGWRGINIEPSAEYFERLRLERPRDENVQAVASDSGGSVRFFEIPGTGLSTIEPGIKDRHAERGYEVVEHDIAAIRLDDLCARLGVGEVHFLKIDVEGAERRVLRGFSLERHRPWIVLVEATIPLTAKTSHEEWEQILFDAGYSFVYFDGVNRFYVADEHSALRDAFREPPSVGDDYVRYTRRRLRFMLRRLKHAVAVAKRRTESAGGGRARRGS